VIHIVARRPKPDAHCFTHFGLSGPVILSLSAHIKPEKKYTVSIDLKPALDDKTLDNRLLTDFGKYANKDFINALDDLLPQKIIPTVVELSKIPARKKVNEITREERRALAEVLRNFTLTFRRFRPIDEAIVTRGGISVKEVNPKTMESKLISGLYFAGEVLDLDAYTGGFNLQIAFCTARLAADSIMENQA
jgi:predicted Rossmann fold flavoprotein